MRPCDGRCGIAFENDDAVEVVRHDDECIQSGSGEMVWNGQPGLLGEFTIGVQYHLALMDGPENGGSLVGTKGDQIIARLGIIETSKPDRLPVGQEVVV